MKKLFMLMTMVAIMLGTWSCSDNFETPVENGTAQNQNDSREAVEEAVGPFCIIRNDNNQGSSHVYINHAYQTGRVTNRSYFNNLGGDSPQERTNRMHNMLANVLNGVDNNRRTNALGARSMGHHAWRVVSPNPRPDSDGFTYYIRVRFNGNIGQHMNNNAYQNSNTIQFVFYGRATQSGQVEKFLITAYPHASTGIGQIPNNHH